MLADHVYRPYAITELRSLKFMQSQTELGWQIDVPYPKRYIRMGDGLWVEETLPVFIGEAEVAITG